MAEPPIRPLLAGRDRRSLGHAARVAAIIAAPPARFAACVAAMADDDPLIPMWAADAMEKASRNRPDLLTDHQADVLGPLARFEQPEVQWHLLQRWPRLALTMDERRAALALAER